MMFNIRWFNLYIDVLFQHDFCFQHEEIMIQTQVLITSAAELSLLFCIPGTFQFSVSSSSVRPGSKMGWHVHMFLLGDYEII